MFQQLLPSSVRAQRMLAPQQLPTFLLSVLPVPVVMPSHAQGFNALMPLTNFEQFRAAAPQSLKPLPTTTAVTHARDHDFLSESSATGSSGSAEAHSLMSSEMRGKENEEQLMMLSQQSTVMTYHTEDFAELDVVAADGYVCPRNYVIDNYVDNLRSINSYGHRDQQQTPRVCRSVSSLPGTPIKTTHLTSFTQPSKSSVQKRRVCNSKLSVKKRARISHQQLQAQAEESFRKNWKESESKKVESRACKRRLDFKNERAKSTLFHEVSFFLLHCHFAIHPYFDVYSRGVAFLLLVIPKRN